MMRTVFSRLTLGVAATAAMLFCLGADPVLAGCSKSVVLYSASWCPYCRQVREIFARNHIRYRLLDATTASVQSDMIRRFGDTAVPRTLIGGALVEGVDEARIKQLCAGPTGPTTHDAASSTAATWRGNTGEGAASSVPGFSRPFAPSAAKPRAEAGTPSWSSSLLALSGTTG